ncbi:ATP-binding cassette domain-containing protein, partial [Levilactobacillus brevis]|nr:ATP-binding cassette domain-containing protein [Levilactobacillus brevis]MCE6026372.1 ATP-binding cassette domain-containing protein [Levilactobacillus brevis]MCE6037180.1 ATP-binding cassette domain-containing protein [Levilactobacillus brevis]
MQINQKTILNDISLDLTSGEKILIKAPSGFGKTTLLRALIGDVSVHSGEYRLNDLSVSQISKVELKQYFGFV